ncbi:hypothetical protein ABMA28_003404 [Loxostege sticticalis]|uniref:Uncharacterized protein n=1 Tax=Loxostege sticticalis TaxID=481309 RepID=A0ABD0SX47_LOXSC
METKLLFLLLLACVAYTVGQDSSDSSDSSDSNDNSSSSGSGSGEDNDYSYPCSLDDLDCIRDYFAQSGMCTKVSHQDGKSIQRPKLVGFLPSFNSSYTCLDNTITFDGSKIESFYVNKRSNNLVMTIYFDGCSVYTERLQLAIHVRGRENVLVEDYVNITYTAALTGIFPKAGLNGLIGAAVSSYNINPSPPLELGAKISESSNEVVSNWYNALENDISTGVNELLLTEGPFLYSLYIQTYICNYGVEHTGDLIL